MFSNLSRAEIYNRKVKGKSIYKIELKSTTFVKLTCVIINRNNFRARIFNQIQIPARETSRSLGSRLRRSPLAIRDRLVGKSKNTRLYILDVASCCCFKTTIQGDISLPFRDFREHLLIDINDFASCCCFKTTIQEDISLPFQDFREH